MHVREALNYLKQTNIHYKDVEFNKDRLNEFCRQQENDIQEENDSNVVTGETSAGTGDELLHDRQQHCMFQDRCLMPVDIGQEMLDQYFDNIKSGSC